MEWVLLITLTWAWALTTGWLLRTVRGHARQLSDLQHDVRTLRNSLLHLANAARQSSQGMMGLLALQQALHEELQKAQEDSLSRDLDEREVN
jgi:biopolymer transport protein ExbB/TolQ